MSGIVALASQDGAPVDGGLLRRLTDSLAFRGPDRQDIWCDGPIGLGHALLSCDDSTEDRQPCTLDGEVWITADARIDARDDLVRRLGVRGERSDAELILEAYRTWGEGCVEQLLGDFAFAIWDGRARRLFAARDHFGVKPFYFARTKDGLILGNTLGCLRLHPAVSSRVNEQTVGDFLLFGTNYNQATTIFADIRRVPPAHSLSWHEGELHLRRYWRLPTDQHRSYRSEADCVDAFREVLRQAVSDRIRGKSVGVFMSGGLDSTAVAAAAREVLAARGKSFDLRAYTIVYDRLIPDEERRYSTLAAESLGMSICHQVADDYLPFDGWDEWHPPEPIDQPLAAATIDLLKYAATDHRVVLTGQGGDAVFHATPLYLIELLGTGQWLRWFLDVGGYLLGRGKMPPLGFRNWWRSRQERGRIRTARPEWIAPAFAKRACLDDRLQEVTRSGSAEHPSHPVAHHLLQLPGWTSMFEVYDPGSMCVPVEFRNPLFDLRLIDFVLGLKPMPWCIDKDLMRAGMCGRLPDRVRKRRKTLLAGNPFQQMLRRGWHWSESVPGASPIREYVVVDKVISSLEQFAQPHGEDAYSVVRPLSLDRWFCSFTRCPSSLPWEFYHAAV